MNGSEDERHIAMEIDPEWLIVHATGISEDDLVAIGKLLGVVEE